MKTRTFLMSGACIAVLSAIGLSLYANNPATHQSTPAVTPEEMISGFYRPNIIKALYENDLPELKKDKVRNFLYINTIIEATSSQEAFYRMNQAELLLDPQLKFIASGVIATNSDIQNYLINTGISAGLGALSEFLKSRNNSNRNKSINPIDEITSFNRGLLIGSSDIALLKADADYDAKKLMFLAPSDPSSFNRIYATIRQFVRHF